MSGEGERWRRAKTRSKANNEKRGSEAGGREVGVGQSDVEIQGQACKQANIKVTGI